MASPQTHVDAGWLADRLQASTAKDLGSGLSRLIDGGELAPGAHLPTIRDFARAAGVSPGTVMTAWSRVRDTGRLHTRRRGGTVVADLRPSALAIPSRTFDWSQVEMSFVSPDAGQQPDLRSAIAEALTTPDLHAAERAYITPALLRSSEASWPFPAQAWNCVGGGIEALVLATAAAALRPNEQRPNEQMGVKDRVNSTISSISAHQGGGRVAVEEPVSPGYLDILRQLGIDPVGVCADGEGPTVASVSAALEHGVTAFVLQPSGAYALNGALTSKRASELAGIIPADVWIVEDDSAGPLTDSEPASLGTYLPDQVIRVRSYCKAYGIDLRTAVIGGCAELVDRTIRMRSFGMASNSRLLQNTAAALIRDQATAETMRRARASYRCRRHTALDAFARAGLSASASAQGFVLWVPVPDETSALISLARQGIVVAAGAKSFVSPQVGLLRISLLQLPDDPELINDLAVAVRSAVNSAEREYFD